MGVIFVAGVYGVGKSTLCKALSQILKLPFYSASDLISKVNREKYGTNKAVKDKFYNQEILINEINKKLNKYPTILLAGHFCIFDKDNSVDILPKNVFKEMQIEQILLLETDVDRIIYNLKKRDGKQYTSTQILRLIKEEKIMAERVAKENECLLHIHKMEFNENDLDMCVSILNGII